MIKKILVADNSITIQKIVAMAFEQEDAVVEGISKGKDALDKMKTFKPDIVLADIDMRDLTGFELSKKIKNDPKFNPTKVLLLASDFEDFNKSLFDSSGADDHIAKPFKSEDIIKKVNDLLSEKSPDSINETINLTPVDLEVSVESTETTIELSTEDMLEEENSTINLSSADLDESIGPAPVEEVEQKKFKEDTLDTMIKDVESLKKEVEPSDADYDELSEEVAPTQEDAVGDELDMAFREIVNFGSPKEPDNISSNQLEPISGPSTVEGIIPEPEDLLGGITSSSVEGENRLTVPSSMGENSSHPSQVSHKIKSQQATTTQENQTLADQVGHPPEDMIHAFIERELSELSNSITQSVREIVQEITPKIVRVIVKEEIDKIKNS
ncbi:response regulator [Nitrospinaceae bacterium]|nr:response regulator [Nitrospinaceae bacterium]